MITGFSLDREPRPPKRGQSNSFLYTNLDFQQTKISDCGYLAYF